MSFKIVEETPYTDPHSRGTGSIVTERKGYILRTRGEHNRIVRHDYACPMHGVHEHMVPSGDVPDTMPCPVEIGWYLVYQEANPGNHPVFCGAPSTWRHPIVAQGLSAGSVKS